MLCGFHLLQPPQKPGQIGILLLCYKCGTKAQRLNYVQSSDVARQDGSPRSLELLPLIRKWGWPPQGRRWIIFVLVDLLSASCRFPILVIIEIAPQHLWSSVSGFFHFARCFQGSSMSQHVSVLHSFSLPNIPLYGYTTFVYSCIIWWTFGVVCSLGDCEQCCEYFGVHCMGLIGFCDSVKLWGASPASKNLREDKNHVDVVCNFKGQFLCIDIDLHLEWLTV